MIMVLGVSMVINQVMTTTITQSRTDLQMAFSVSRRKIRILFFGFTARWHFSNNRPSSGSTPFLYVELDVCESWLKLGEG